MQLLWARESAVGAWDSHIWWRAMPHSTVHNAHAARFLMAAHVHPLMIIKTARQQTREQFRLHEQTRQEASKQTANPTQLNNCDGSMGVVALQQRTAACNMHCVRVGHIPLIDGPSNVRLLLGWPLMGSWQHPCTQCQKRPTGGRSSSENKPRRS